MHGTLEQNKRYTFGNEAAGPSLSNMSTTSLKRLRLASLNHWGIKLSFSLLRTIKKIVLRIPFKLGGIIQGDISASFFGVRKGDVRMSAPFFLHIICPAVYLSALTMKNELIGASLQELIDFRTIRFFKLIPWLSAEELFQSSCSLSIAWNEVPKGYVKPNLRDLKKVRLGWRLEMKWHSCFPCTSSNCHNTPDFLLFCRSTSSVIPSQVSGKLKIAL